jgi:hypothetical protein
VRPLQELEMHRKVQLVVSGGIRSGADTAKPGAGRRRGLDRRRGGSRARGQVRTPDGASKPRRWPVCGKSHLHNLEPEDRVALTLEASATAKVPLAGTEWIPGRAASR